METILELLTGADLCSKYQSNKIAGIIKNQEDFDDLFQHLFNNESVFFMGEADAVEKLTADNYYYLNSHKKNILELCKKASNKELKLHLALLVPRLNLTKDEIGKMWKLLSLWALDKKENRIVRVNSLQGLFNLLKQNKDFKREFDLLVFKLEMENILSLNTSKKKLRVRFPQL